MIALIDADSILYVIGYHNRDLPFNEDSKAQVENNVDLYVRAMLQRVQATSYLGVFSSHQCFRDYSYLYAPYKGHRPPKPEFMVKWESTMKEYLTKEWGFITIEDLEADDVVSAYQVDSYKRKIEAIVLSPDKDLRQNPGLFYDYKKNIFETVTEQQAMKNFYLAVLTGDPVDNVKGEKCMPLPI